MKGRKAFQYGLRQLRQRHRKALEHAERTPEQREPEQEITEEPPEEQHLSDDLRALVKELTANPPVTNIKFGPSGDLLVMRGKHRQVVRAPKREEGISDEDWQELGEFMKLIAQARSVAGIVLENWTLLVEYSDGEVDEISLPITGGGGSSTTIEKGWSPLLAVVEDGERRVLQVKDWTGGGGPKPTVGKYLGPEGFVTNASDATDIRGAAGSGGGGGASAVYIGPEDDAPATVTEPTLLILRETGAAARDTRMVIREPAP